MLYALMVNVDQIYCGNEAFEDGESYPITASVDNGEGGYVEIYSNKLDRPFRVYSGEYDAFVVEKGK